MKSDRIFSLKKFEERRKEMRKKPTPEEALLWKNLRGKRNKIKFRRQHSIGPYIADFYCPECNLVIELDGSHHKDSESKQYDKERTRYFKALGIKVIRFWNSEVSKDLVKVLKTIKEHTLPLSL